MAELIRFRRLPMKTHGVHKFRGVRYTGGEVIRLRSKDELGGHTHGWEQLDPDPPEPQPSTGLLGVERAEERGTYDVLHPVSGVKQNVHPLTREQAAAMTDGNVRDLPPADATLTTTTGGSGADEPGAGQPAVGNKEPDAGKEGAGSDDPKPATTTTSPTTRKKAAGAGAGSGGGSS